MMDWLFRDPLLLPFMALVPCLPPNIGHKLFGTENCCEMLPEENLDNGSG